MPKDTTTPASAVIGKRKPKATHRPASKISRDWTEEIRKSSLFSARTTQENYLKFLKKTLRSVAEGDTGAVRAEDLLRRQLQNMGYDPISGFPEDAGKYTTKEIPPAVPGTMTDLSSSPRLKLILTTQVRQARSMGQMATSENPVMLLGAPAWRLVRQGARKKMRSDWDKRWSAAGRSVGWTGAAKSDMVALKTSPIWSALGSGAGNFDDTLGLPFPPFAFGSGMAWSNVTRREWKRIADAEGIPDGLDDIKAEALKLYREK